MMMKITLFFVSLLLLSNALAQQHDEPHPSGVIHGTANAKDGQPAKNVQLVAFPFGVALGAVVPHTKTNDAGEYRFENLPWWGRYTVFADDEEAGYSNLHRETVSGPSEAEITPEHPEAGLNLSLPPKSGFLRIELTNRETAAGISTMRITVMAAENPGSPLFTLNCHSNRFILLPPDKNLLLHVTSDGFREWDESFGEGKLLLLPSGTKRTIVVQLEPAD